MNDKQQMNQEELDNIYNQVLQSLKQGGRPSLNFNYTEIKEVSSNLNGLLLKGEKNLIKPLAILCHIRKGQEELIPLLYKAYLSAQPDQKMFVLQALQKHSLEVKSLKGKKVDSDTIEILKHALASTNIELQNYALQLIEQLSTQLICFKIPLKKIANKFSFFDKNKNENKLLAKKLLSKIPNF